MWSPRKPAWPPLTEKDGSKGPFVRITRETTYRIDDGTAHGVIAARTRQIGIAR